jgi:hypothetical protein
MGLTPPRRCSTCTGWPPAAGRVAAHLGTRLTPRQVDAFNAALPGGGKLTILWRKDTPELRPASLAALAHTFYVKVVPLPAR